MVDIKAAISEATISPINPAGKKVIMAGYAKSSFTILGSMSGNAA